ncbi:TetR/AcrR family transcriptional regulator [Patulibacter minatonensis]|uniref:TetR/AcrR family transcriptional regulator n=1 Tax=Patulibacter minatonensis TaxID=298163 RepID=UPI000687DCC8|nr:TetR/AcrR family transcriptional regulator [Patulibacter minatonensis]
MPTAKSPSDTTTGDAPAEEKSEARPATRRTRDPQRGPRILQAATELFYERGYHAVSVDEIGEAAGATGAAIYRHFSGKDEILATLFDDAQDRYLIAVPDPTEDPFTDLAVLISRSLELTLAQRELASIWAHEHRALSAPQQRRLWRRSRQYLERWVVILRRCFPERSDKDLIAAARSALGILTSLASIPGRTVSEGEAKIAQQMAMAGLRSLGEPEAPPQQ